MMGLAPPRSAAAEVRVGVAVPLSGRMAPVGLAIAHAVQAAVTEANAAGGVLGDAIAVEVVDDGCASARAEDAAGRLIASKPALVIGHPCSNAATAAGPLYGNAEVLLVAVGPRHADVTRANGTRAVPVLRLAGRDDRQGDAAAAWLLAHAPGRRVALLHDRTAYARGLSESAAGALERAGTTPVARLTLVAGKPDYEEAVDGLRDSGAEAIFFAGYPEEAAIVLSGLERGGYTGAMLGSDSLATPAFAEAAERAAVRVAVLLPHRADQRAAEAGTDGADAAAFGAEARGALEAWMEAARQAGSVEARTLSGILRGTPVATRTLGEIRFDANGDLVTRDFAAASAQAGRWVIGKE